MGENLNLATTLAEPLTAGEILACDINWTDHYDLLFPKVNAPSHGVGYQIRWTTQACTHVLFLHQDGREPSKMIRGNSLLGLKVKAYMNFPGVFQ